MLVKVFLVAAILVTSSLGKRDFLDLLEELVNEKSLEETGLEDLRALEADLGDEQVDDELRQGTMKLEQIEKAVRMIDEDPNADAIATKPVLSSKPIVPSGPCNPCCPSGYLLALLTRAKTPWTTNSLQGVTVDTYTPASSNGVCDGQMLIKANFDKASSDPNCDFCQRQPVCGKSVLKITLHLSRNSRSGWLVNVGDSVTNNGYGGDSNTQTNDAEFQLVGNTGTIYTSDVCKSQRIDLGNFLSPVARYLILYISNNHIAFEQYPGGNRRVICNKCLYALNGQADPSSGGPNEDVYIALNRVVSLTSGRTGTGVCAVHMSWECPISSLSTILI